MSAVYSIKFDTRNDSKNLELVSSLIASIVQSLSQFVEIKLISTSWLIRCQSQASISSKDIDLSSVVENFTKWLNAKKFEELESKFLSELERKRFLELCVAKKDISLMFSTDLDTYIQSDYIVSL